MARAATPPGARLLQLKHAKEKAAKLKRGELLSAQPMAELLGVSWPALRAWSNEVEELTKLDAFVRGGNGVEWAFRPIQTINALIAHFEAKQKASVRRAQRVKKIVAGNALQGAPEDLSIDELTKMVRLSREIREEQVRQGELIEAAEARMAVMSFMSSIQEAALRAAQEQDPNGRWPPEIRESFEAATQNLLVAIERAGHACIQKMDK